MLTILQVADIWLIKFGLDGINSKPTVMPSEGPCVFHLPCTTFYASHVLLRMKRKDVARGQSQLTFIEIFFALHLIASYSPNKSHRSVYDQEVRSHCPPEGHILLLQKSSDFWPRNEVPQQHRQINGIQFWTSFKPCKKQILFPMDRIRRQSKPKVWGQQLQEELSHSRERGEPIGWTSPSTKSGFLALADKGLLTAVLDDWNCLQIWAITHESKPAPTLASTGECNSGPVYHCWSPS